MNNKVISGTILIILVFAVGANLSIGKKSGIHDPMSRYDDRSKLLRYGMYVTPDPSQNPIDPPERFSGYHTALDLEIFPDEEQKPVEIFAICSGSLKYKGQNEGYGGVIVQSCNIDDQPVTVLYGHVDISSVKKGEDQNIKAGEVLAQLGDHRSEETSGTRKHLHLAIHKGEQVELLGYVQDQEKLKEYINPEEVLR